jgi:hypothetical protein
MYSLGVVLLEIGHWQSHGSLLAPKQKAEDFKFEDWHPKRWDLRKRLLSIAENDLPPVIGTVYADIVVAMLTMEEQGPDGEDWRKLPAQQRLVHMGDALSELCAAAEMTLELEKEE